MARHRDSIEHHHRLTRLKAALRANWSSNAMALHSRLERCQGPDWGHRYTCRSPACPACRDRYVGAQRRQAITRFAGTPNEELVHVSIVLGATPHAEEIGPIVRTAARGLRNRIATERRASALWAPVELVAWLEVDAIDVEHYPRLGPDKREQIGEFSSVSYGQEGVIWAPSWHGIMRLGPLLDIGQAREAFVRQWSGHRQVHLQPFSPAVPVNVNLSRIINYACKYTCTTDYYDVDTGEITPREWETSWLGTYYSWLHGWSRGFHSTRISIKPQTFKFLNVTDHVVKDDIDLDPLPFVYSSSHFDRDYITGAWK